MASDEAVVRIVLEEPGRGNTSAGPAGASTLGPTSTSDPFGQSPKQSSGGPRMTPAEWAAAGYPQTRAPDWTPPPPPPPTQPPELLQKDREPEKTEATDEELAPKFSTPGSGWMPVSTPTATKPEEIFGPPAPPDLSKTYLDELARDLEEYAKKWEAVEEQYAKMPAEVKTGFDPVELAKKRLDREKQLALVDAEYAKLKPPEPIDVEPVFDPAFEARKRKERENRRKQVDDAYKAQFGGDEEKKKAEKKETGLDQLMKVADALRGTMGGVFGTLVGATLDVVSGVKKAQSEAPDKSEKEKFLATVDGSTNGKAPLDTSLATEGMGSAPSEPPMVKPFDLPDKDSAPIPVKPIDSAGKAADIAGKFKAPPGQGTTTGAAAKSGQSSDIAAVGTEVGAGAEVAGGMLSGVAAAAGPIGIAVAAAVAVVDALKGALKSAVGGVSDFANAVASPSADPSVPIGQLGDAASKVGDKLTYVSPALGLMVVGLGESTKALASFMQVLDKTVERYGDYSPQIAQQQAIAEVRQTLGDLRRAQEVAPEFARYIQAQSDLQQKFEDIKVKLLVKIVPAVTRVLEILEKVVPSGDGIENAINALTAAMSVVFPSIAALLASTLERELRPEVNDPTSQLDDVLFRTSGSGTDREPGLVPRI